MACKVAAAAEHKSVAIIQARRVPSACASETLHLSHPHMHIWNGVQLDHAQVAEASEMPPL